LAHVGVFGVSDIDSVKNDIQAVKQLHAGVFLDEPLIGFADGAAGNLGIGENVTAPAT
jgi:hypothetical protein